MTHRARGRSGFAFGAVLADELRRLGVDGTVCITSSQPMELVVDLFGHYSPTAGSKYQPITTLRLCSLAILRSKRMIS